MCKDCHLYTQVYRAHAPGTISAKDWAPSSQRQIPHMSASSGSVCKRIMCLHDKDGTDAEAAPTAVALGKPQVAWRKSRPVNLLSVVFFIIFRQKGAAIGDDGK
jgi:hypothetical protein